jgi:glycosyltransferase involved in cell wall biosynthesis
VVQIGAYRTDPKALAEKIDQMAQDDTFYAWSLDRAREIAENRSWKTLKPLYDKTFHNLMQQPINY